MEARSGPADGPPAEVAAPPKQRWRLVLARDPAAPPLGGRELIEAWDATLEASGLPLHRPAGRPRARIAFAAPLPLGIGAEHELAELFLAERVPVWRLREALQGRLPVGWELLDAFDVWVGGPPLAGRVTGAQYRVTLGVDVPAPMLVQACEALLAATTLPRTRQKRDALVPYDLRPLLWSLNVADSGPPTMLRIRTRTHPELGSGRPEEVIAALGERVRQVFDATSIVRERIILAEDLAQEEFNG